MSELETLIQQELSVHRIISIRIPSFNSAVYSAPRIPGYKGYVFTEEGEVLTRQRSGQKIALLLTELFIKISISILKAFHKVAASIAQDILTETKTTAKEIIQDGKFWDYKFFKELTYFVKIRRKCAKREKKVKKLIYILVDDSTSQNTKDTIEILKELIETRYIADAALIVLSSIRFGGTEQITLQLSQHKDENIFLHQFGENALKHIRAGRYEDAGREIHSVLKRWDISDPDEFEFVMQCLAFCYECMIEREFRDQFKSLPLSGGTHLDTAFQKNLVEHTGYDHNFIAFCSSLLPEYFRDRSGIWPNDVARQKIVFEVVKRAKLALEKHDKIYAAAQLFAKYAPSNEIADAYILAYVHMEFVSNLINDECLERLQGYAPISHRAELFLSLLNLNKQEQPSAYETLCFLNEIKNFQQVPTLVRLCFYYYLANPVYKSERHLENYLLAFQAEYLSLHEDSPLKVLFAAQFLLISTVVEDSSIRKKYGKFLDLTLIYVLENHVTLKDKRIYFKICRSLNGLRVDRFLRNLNSMLEIKSQVKNYPDEQVYFYNNLGAMYAYCGKFDEALTCFSDIEVEYLRRMPLSIQASYVNNETVCRYLNNPSIGKARELQAVLGKYLEEKFAESVTEETKHLFINRLILTILAGKSDQTIESRFLATRDVIGDDPYFCFYLQQAEWLYCAMRGKDFPTDSIVQSVFFRNKRSLFEQKQSILSKIKGATIKKINQTLAKELSAFGLNGTEGAADYEYFKRADLFSFVERWYE